MAQLLSIRAAVISYGLLIGWQVPPAIDQFTAGSWWWDVCAPGLLRHRNLQATRLFCQHPVSPDLEGLPNLGDLPHLVLSFDLFIAATAIKPPKAACQFAADDILLYKFAIISNGFTSPFGKKEKKNCHLYNTILSLYISYQDITRRVC